MMMMKQICLSLLLLLSMRYRVYCVTEGGSNVCTTTSRRANTYSSRYSTSCGFFGWSRCTRYRYHVRYTVHVNHVCCIGTKSNDGTSCLIKVSQSICGSNVNNLNTTGANAQTVLQDESSTFGVNASNSLLDRDLSTLSYMINCYRKVGETYCLQPALIAAMASRESRGGRLLNETGGFGNSNNTYGILQCGLRNSTFPCRQFSWNSCDHINMMVQHLLVPYINEVGLKHPSWNKDQHVQGGVAAYNFGVKNVQTWEDLDKGTSNDDYSNDVIARAQRLINKHGW